MVARKYVNTFEVLVEKNEFVAKNLFSFKKVINFSKPEVNIL